MEDIARNYGAIYSGFQHIYEIAFASVENSEFLHQKDKREMLINLAYIHTEIDEVLEKAQAYDELKYKQSQGGKKSARNMTKKQREERARKAGQTRH